ncbi:hypothetical protein ACLKA6_006077 [Drosophila palustris]
MYKLLMLLAIVSCVHGRLCSDCGLTCDQTYCAEGTLYVGCIKKLVFSKACGLGVHRYIKVNGALRENILQNVNVFRNVVASGLYYNMSAASRMPTMGWDKDLANSAMVLVHNCDYKKLCSNMEKYHYVATIELSGTVKHYQNVAKDLIDIVVPTWFNDLDGCRMNAQNHILPKAKAKANGTCVGHYIPLLQDRGDRMGCAVRLTENLDPNGVSTVTMICNLSRADVNDMPPYEVSDVPGQDCEAGRNSDYEFLCDPNEQVDPNYVEPIRADEGCAQKRKDKNK